VDLAAIDVCDFDDVHERFAGLTNVAGVVRGAGAMTATSIANLGQEEMTKVLSSRKKRRGKSYVAVDKSAVKLKFFILFSSISTKGNRTTCLTTVPQTPFLMASPASVVRKGQVATGVQWGLLECGDMTNAESEKFLCAMSLSLLPVTQICATINTLMSQSGRRARKLAVAVVWAKFKAWYEMKGAKPLLEKVGVGTAAGAIVSSSFDSATQSFNLELLQSLLDAMRRDLL